MVSFIHNGSDIRTWIEHTLETKSTKSRTKFLRETTSSLNFKLQTIRLAQGHWS